MVSVEGSFLLPMFHPSYLLRNESKKKGPKSTWRDINALRRKWMPLGENIKGGRSS
ncbi:hypothetical protein MASR2M17_04430 [Aminivibrio sp.]